MYYTSQDSITISVNGTLKSWGSKANTVSTIDIVTNQIAFGLPNFDIVVKVDALIAIENDLPLNTITSLE